MAMFNRLHGDTQPEDRTSQNTVTPAASQFRTIQINSAIQPQSYISNHVTTAKYTVITFLPKFLFEQFRRYANVFFLIIGLLQQIPDVSPTGRYVTLVPFTIILGLTAVKELIEDYKRHRDDSRVNNTITEVYSLEKQKFEERRWKDITVGDILNVICDKPFPADLILLASSEDSGMCFVETANLDGETNLKIRTAMPITQEKFEVEEDIGKYHGTINCELPNRMLYEFKGNIQLDGEEKVPVPEDTILLRGSKLKNTNWIYGIVVYSGADTKFMMNSTKAPLKRSHMDIITNYQIAYLFLLLIIMSLTSAAGNKYITSNGDNHYYVANSDSNFFFNCLTFVILYNNLIPISLLVTLEFVKFFQAYFVNWDMEMYHAESDTYALARTSNLNEELGQVKYVFSDKTGTLTRNVMEFKAASIAGISFHVDDSSKTMEDARLDAKKAKVIWMFFTHLSVCHSVIPEADPEDPGKLTYNASSPDEEALVKGAAHYGFTFERRTQSDVFIRVSDTNRNNGDEVYSYEVKEIIAFTSKRKRMSVIVKDRNQTSGDGLLLLIKGADNVILGRLAKGGDQSEYYKKTLDHIQEFAEQGLRTLCLAVRHLTKAEFYAWQMDFKKAKADPTPSRDELVELCADKIEQELELIGATGIEDKLQEGVPETIADLLKANIHVWMLTGDKQETAINIGRSCNLLHHGNNTIIVDTDSLDKTRDLINQNLSRLKDLNSSSSSSSSSNLEKNELVIDGESLAYALNHSLRNDFIDLCCMCNAVICCRVSPMQKADMVELVQKHTKAICLSIGDGANDVAMIQKANVGVGISGNEGLQAANSSDFAIAQFRYLSRLLFVHGAWFNARNSKVILYSFYKNICLYIIELWFAFYSYWTGQVLFERWTIGLYNMLMTSAPPVAIGLFDQNCSANARMDNPQLYRDSQESRFFNLKIFWRWIFNAIVHSVFLYWLPMLFFGEGVVWKNGFSGEYLVLGNIVYSCVVITVCLKAGLALDSWNWLCHLAIWGSIFIWFSFLSVYSYVWPLGIKLAPNMAGMIELVYTTPMFWFSIILVPFFSLIPDVVLKSLRITIKPTETDEVRIREKFNTQPVPSEGSSLLGHFQRFRNRTFDRPNVAGMEMQPPVAPSSSGFAFSVDESRGAQEKSMNPSAETSKRQRSQPSRELSAASRGLPGTVTL